MAVWICLSTLSFGQKTDAILQEGKLLYQLEKAAWMGTESFLDRYNHLKESVGGYVSYKNEKGQLINLFYNKENPVRIVARFSFELNPEMILLRSDTLPSEATSYETDLITLRQDALRRISVNEEGFFSTYSNTRLNLIPLIQNHEKKLFIITGTKDKNVIYIGNDYLLHYNEKNELINKEKIHQSILQYPCKSGGGNQPASATFHSHVSSEYITSTDICTLLLYKDQLEWRQHYVFGENHVSVFDLDHERLVVLTLEEWNKMKASAPVN